MASKNKGPQPSNLARSKMVQVCWRLSRDLQSTVSVEVGENERLIRFKDAVNVATGLVQWCEGAMFDLYLAKVDGKWLTAKQIRDVKYYVPGLEYKGTRLTRLECDNTTLECAGLGDADVVQESAEEVEKGDGLVHVLVVAPESLTPHRYQDGPTLLQTLDILMGMQGKRGVCVISDNLPPKIDELIPTWDLSTKLIEIEEEPNVSVNGFQWAGQDSMDSGERAQCMKYMEKHLVDVFVRDGTQEFYLKDTVMNENFLAMDDISRMPFAVMGTTDMVIIDRFAQQEKNEFAGLRVVIDVRKDVIPNLENYRRRMFLELIAADFKSGTRHIPVGLLTDLNAVWLFFWFTADFEVATLSLQYPANGFQFVKDVLAEDSGPSCGGCYLMRSSIVGDDSAMVKGRLTDASCLGS